MTQAEDASPTNEASTAPASAERDDHRWPMANAIRALAMDAVEAAQSGHPGMPMGAADVATVLFTQIMKFDAGAPDWPDRDRFILSAGHGSMLLYSCLHLLGYDGMTIEELKKFRQLGSRTPGHPEFGNTPGVETTTGPLGQGLANAVGMAIAERLMAARFGDDIVDHRTYVLAGDGDLMEGISHEAISLAGHLKLAKLTVLFDDNGISIDGPTSLTETGDQLQRFTAAGWAVRRIDGHNPDAICQAIEAAQEENQPSLIACRTRIGYGSPNKEGTAGVHGAPLGPDEYQATRAALGIDYPAFEVPAEARDAWRIAGLRGRQARKAWEDRLATLDPEVRAEFERRLRGDLPADLVPAITKLKQQFIEKPQAIATRTASQRALDAINAVMPETVGGSADLTGSNNTRSAYMAAVTADDFSGRYIHYGVREHAMAAAMNGMALHGGIVPYGGTFLVFSDYCRPAMRLSALMGQRVIYVMTHDSIGLGEDGPTHQPVEHLAALRVIPNLAVFRPADAIETAECWQLALERTEGPSVIVLSRQNLEPLRDDADEANRCRLGAYELSAADEEARVSLFSSGSEVAIALDAKRQLEGEGIATRVVSVPCFELFADRGGDDRKAVIGNAKVNIAVEAGVRTGWARYVGREGRFIGMTGFGASGPYQELYEHFGITAEHIVAEARAGLED